MRSIKDGSKVGISNCDCCKHPVALEKGIICPICHSLPRQRNLIKFLNYTDIFTKTCRVLHFAPEECLKDIFESYDNIEYITTDILGDVTVRMDITDNLFKDNVFDYVICSHVLEHIENDRQAISEIARVLKPSGLALIQIPIDKNRQKTYEDSSIKSASARKKAFGQHDHVRIYGKDFINRLSKFSSGVIDDIYVCKKNKIA